jgi:hypothetical protein
MLLLPAKVGGPELCPGQFSQPAEPALRKSEQFRTVTEGQMSEHGGEGN